MLVVEALGHDHLGELVDLFDRVGHDVHGALLAVPGALLAQHGRDVAQRDELLRDEAVVEGIGAGHRLERQSARAGVSPHRAGEGRSAAAGDAQGDGARRAPLADRLHVVDAELAGGRPADGRR